MLNRNAGRSSSGMRWPLISPGEDQQRPIFNSTGRPLRRREEHFKLQNANDGLVKSLKSLLSVIPAQAGIQYFHIVRILWIPVFTGMTTFYESIIYSLSKKVGLIKHKIWSGGLRKR